MIIMQRHVSNVQLHVSRKRNSCLSVAYQDITDMHDCINIVLAYHKHACQSAKYDRLTISYRTVYGAPRIIKTIRFHYWNLSPHFYLASHVILAPLDIHLNRSIFLNHNGHFFLTDFIIPSLSGNRPDITVLYITYRRPSNDRCHFNFQHSNLRMTHHRQVEERKWL